MSYCHSPYYNHHQTLTLTVSTKPPLLLCDCQNYYCHYCATITFYCRYDHNPLLLSLSPLSLLLTSLCSLLPIWPQPITIVIVITIIVFTTDSTFMGSLSSLSSLLQLTLFQLLAWLDRALITKPKTITVSQDTTPFT